MFSCKDPDNAMECTWVENNRLFVTSFNICPQSQWATKSPVMVINSLDHCWCPDYDRIFHRFEFPLYWTDAFVALGKNIETKPYTDKPEP